MKQRNNRDNWNYDNGYDDDRFSDEIEDDAYEEYPERHRRRGAGVIKFLTVIVAAGLALAAAVGGYRLMSGILSPDGAGSTAQKGEQYTAVSISEETETEADAASGSTEAGAAASSAAAEAAEDPEDAESAVSEAASLTASAGQDAEADLQTGSAVPGAEDKAETAVSEAEEKAASEDTEDKDKAESAVSEAEEKSSSADSEKKEKTESSDSEAKEDSASASSDAEEGSSSDKKADDKKESAAVKKNWKEPEDLPEKITYSARYAVGEAELKFDRETGTISMEGGHPDLIGLVPPEEFTDRSFWIVACSMPDTYRTEFILSHLDWIKDGSVGSFQMDGKKWDFTVNDKKQVTNAVLTTEDGETQELVWKYDQEGRLTDIQKKVDEKAAEHRSVIITPEPEEEEPDPGLHIVYYGDWPGWFSSYGEEDPPEWEYASDEERDMAVYSEYGVADGEYRAADGTYEVYDPGDGASVTIANTENNRYSTIIWMNDAGQPHHIEKIGPIRTWIYDTDGRLARIVGGVKGAVTETVEYICADAEITEDGVAWIGVTGDEKEEDEEDEEETEGDSSSESAVTESENDAAGTGSAARQGSTARQGNAAGTGNTAGQGNAAGTGAAAGH